MQKAKKVLNHFGYNESQFDISDVYTGHRKKTVNEIFEKIALANLLGSDKKVRVTIVICTPKVRHFWRCIFLWQRKDKNIENTRQNSNYLL